MCFFGNVNFKRTSELIFANKASIRTIFLKTTTKKHTKKYENKKHQNTALSQVSKSSFGTSDKFQSKPTAPPESPNGLTLERASAQYRQEERSPG